MRSVQDIKKLLNVVFLFLVAGCTTAPDAREASDIITRYFHAKTYRVLELDIADVQPLSMKKKTYMGTDAYVVHIHSITLELTRDSGSPWFYRKGQEVNFKDAAITIREDREKKGKWIIHNISGIAVP